MLTAETNIIIVMCCCLVGIIYAIFNALAIAKIRLVGGASQVESYNKFNDEENTQDPKINLILEVASYIERGSNAFLFSEYKYIGVFVVIMAFVIFFAVEESLGYLWTTVAFLLGAVTSVLSGFIGMRVAVASNYKCAFRA
jgi:Na+/H+-translocating membrane pyrophosphatase